MRAEDKSTGNPSFNINSPFKITYFLHGMILISVTKQDIFPAVRNTQMTRNARPSPSSGIVPTGLGASLAQIIPSTSTMLKAAVSASMNKYGSLEDKICQVDIDYQQLVE